MPPESPPNSANYRPLRVLLLNTDLEVGGTPLVIRELARRLPDESMQVHVACLGRFGPVAEQIRDDGGAVTALDLRAWQAPRGVRDVARMVRREAIDVVLSFLVHANAVAAAAAGLVGSPQPAPAAGTARAAHSAASAVRWLQSIQTTQPRPRWHWIVQRWAARRAERFIVPSESGRDVARQRCGIDPGRVTVIPNGVDAASIAAAPAAPRPQGQPLRVGFLGRLDPIKNVPDLIAAVQQVEDVELHIFGDGPERRRLEALAREAAATASTRRLAAEAEAAGHPGRTIVFHGFAAPADVLAQVELLVLPSSAEGFGNALIEAMAAGIPVIGTDVPGIRHVIDHGRTGLLVPIHDHAALAGAIAAVRADPAAATARAGAALEQVRNHWTWDRIIPQYRAVLRGG